MDLSTKPVPNPSAIFREGVDDWGVLFNLDTAASLALNSTGAFIWKQICRKKSISEIIRTIRFKFNNVPDSITDDVASLLNLLTEEGFVGQEVFYD
jgi:hypothetical protein